MHQITVGQTQGQQEDADPNGQSQPEGSRHSGHLPNQEAEKGPVADGIPPGRRCYRCT
jgi:hypothetical protein